jgi:DNA-binding NarL/FixJ family response regulator
VPCIRILLADDNDAVLAEVREELGAEFETIGTVTNGRDAVEAMQLFNPDVVVLGRYPGFRTDSQDQRARKNSFPHYSGSK